MQLTLETVKAQVLTDHDADDVYLTGLISSALSHIEEELNRPILQREIKQHLDQFPIQDMELPWLNPVTITGIRYWQDGTEHTIPPEEYALDLTNDRERPVLYRKPWDSPWPVIQKGARAITITASVGWLQEELPSDIVMAALLLIGTWYANRENDVIGTITAKLPTGVDRLLQPYKPLPAIG